MSVSALLPFAKLHLIQWPDRREIPCRDMDLDCPSPPAPLPTSGEGRKETELQVTVGICGRQDPYADFGRGENSITSFRARETTRRRVPITPVDTPGECR